MTLRFRLPSAVRSAVICICLVSLGPACRHAWAETIVEAWRSPFGTPLSVSVNVADGTAWVAAGGSVMHLSADGGTLSQVSGFGQPQSVSVNPTDGSCWVADTANGRVVHLAADGSELRRIAGLGALSVSADLADGSCWVAGGTVVHVSDAGEVLWRGGGTVSLDPSVVSVNPTDGSCWVVDANNYQVVHLSSTGEELWRGGGLGAPSSVAVNPTDGSCWVAALGQSHIISYPSSAVTGAVVHLSAAGEEMWRGETFNDPRSVCVDVADSSCWVADTGDGQTVHLSKDGVELWRGAGVYTPWAVSANPADGSCWVADAGQLQSYAYTNGSVLHLSVGGQVLLRRRGFNQPESVAVDSYDGSCWATDDFDGDLVHLSSYGDELWRGSGFGTLQFVAADSGDGSCWVAESHNNRVVHLGPDGAQLWQGTFGWPSCASVDVGDGSCWVTAEAVVHLSPSGLELLRVPGGSPSISANSTDGSCWRADGVNNQVVHTSPTGAELWRGGGFYGLSSVSVNPTDGSCWVADTQHNQVVHLSEAGSEIWRGGQVGWPVFVCVNPTDGSCWVAGGYDVNSSTEVVHLSAAGPELWRGTNFLMPGGVSVDPVDGSCWVADTGHNQVVHLALITPTTPTAAFTAYPRSGVAPLMVAFNDLSANLPSSWTWEFGDGTSSTQENPSHSFVKVGTYIVSLAAANSTGSSQAARPHYIVVTFPDVSTDYWAADQVLACVDAGIVTGYSDGTYKPTDPVARDQMAVYISRALAGGDDKVPTGPATATFSDVPIDYWAFKYVEYAVTQNVVKGYSDGTYKPTDQVDRGQMSVFIARAIATPTAGADLVNYTPPTTATFPDVPTTFWAYKYAEYIAQPGIGVTKGYPDENYHPEYICTRDQMAVYVARAFGLAM